MPVSGSLQVSSTLKQWEARMASQFASLGSRVAGVQLQRGRQPSSSKAGRVKGDRVYNRSKRSSWSGDSTMSYLGRGREMEEVCRR